MDHDPNTALMQHEQDTPVTGPAKIGLELRQVREGLGWHLPDIAAALRIRLPYLEAIERGDLAALPGAAYQTGFVRTYSQALGLDGDEILRRFRAEGTSFVPKAELSFLAPVPDRAVPTGAIVLVCVFLVLTGYGLWYRHTENQARLAAAIPPVPTELAPLAVPPKPPAPPAAQPETQATTPISPAPGTAPGAQAVAQAATPAPPAPDAAANPVAPPSPTLAPTPSPTQIAGQIIQATGDDWVEVKDAQGNILYSHTMHQGDSWPVPNLPGLTMTAGNAGATTLAANGKTSPPLGAVGAVLRDYNLTPAAPGPAQTSPAAPPSSTNPAPKAN